MREWRAVGLGSAMSVAISDGGRRRTYLCHEILYLKALCAVSAGICFAFLEMGPGPEL